MAKNERGAAVESGLGSNLSLPLTSKIMGKSFTIFKLLFPPTLQKDKQN